MSAVFWVAAAAMAIVALAFVIKPLTGDKPALAKRVVVVGACALAIATGLYAALGTPGLATVGASGPVLANPATSTGGQQSSVGTVESLVDGLRERLEAQPGDADGWLLLARSYEHLDRRDEAITAYQQAQALGKTDLEFEAKLYRGDLAAMSPSVAAAPALRGSVSLSADAAARAGRDDVVFIFAKESADHRMPVVAIRRKVRDLPFDFVLTDKEIMIPGATLADFEALVVNAKISPSGSANDDSAGLEAWSEPVSPVNGERVDILIAPVAEQRSNGDE